METLIMCTPSCKDIAVVFTTLFGSITNVFLSIVKLIYTLKWFITSKAVESEITCIPELYLECIIIMCFYWSGPGSSIS
jgi:hypothetical protein